MAPLQWGQKYPGYGVAINFGLEMFAPIELVDMELSDFVIEPQKGGTARLSLRASGHPTTEQRGELCSLIQQDVIVSLIPPKADAVAHEATANDDQGRMFEEVPANDPAQGKTRKKGKAFVDHVLVTGVALYTRPNQLNGAKVTCSDGSEYDVGEWAPRPTLDQIAGAMYDQASLTVEFAPAARQAYDEGDAGDEPTAAAA